MKGLDRGGDLAHGTDFLPRGTVIPCRFSFSMLKIFGAAEASFCCRMKSHVEMWTASQLPHLS